MVSIRGRADSTSCRFTYHPDHRPTQRLISVTLLFACATAICSLFANEAAAQEPPPGLTEVRDGSRHGLWFGAGLGAGGESYDLRTGTGYSGLLYQPTVSLRLGGTVSPHLRLGGEVLSWINEQGDAVESLSSALFVAQYYPASSLGLYLKGGVGIGRNAVDFQDGFGVGDTGFAGLVGAGYELRLGRRFYLNPAVDLVGHTYNGRGGGNYRERLVNFGLGVLVQMGR
jgi:hypothetical protein